MVLTVEERKARRLAGMKKAQSELSEIEKIRRMLLNGRPPVSELKTPSEAIAAAKTLHKELEVRLAGRKAVWVVCVVYISPDLSYVGTSMPISPSKEGKPGNEPEITRLLTGNVMIGLVFAMQEKGGEPVNGARPFLVTKQTDAWLGAPSMWAEGELIDQ